MFHQTCDQDDDEVEIAVDNAAFMDEFFSQVIPAVVALMSGKWAAFFFFIELNFIFEHCFSNAISF